MTQLPFEILENVFKSLSEKDLTQCQLTNKHWNKASVELLYSRVSVNKTHKLILYIRSILDSPRLGRYLQFIHVGFQFSMKKGTVIWDEHNLFDLLLVYCPNLREIEAFGSHFIFWTRLIYAANQGQLSQLQHLPTPDTENIEPYVYTALSFKNTLTSLRISDHIGLAKDIRNINSNAFWKLRDCIKEFPNLQYLFIDHHTNQPFSHLETLIEECPRLIELSVNLYPYRASNIPAEQEILDIQPRPDIRKLTCTWPAIYKDNQLKYVIRKFPNLQHLDIRTDWCIDSSQPKIVYNTSYETMIELVRYTSAIVNVTLELVFNKHDFADYWAEFIRMRNGSSKTCINYAVDGDPDHIVMTYNRKETLELLCAVDNFDTILPHEEFLLKNGMVIESLTVMNTGAASSSIYTASLMNNILKSVDWIYRILQKCPNLIELTLEDLINFKFLPSTTYQHMKLKSLTLLETEFEICLDFLRELSLNVPNLNQLHLVCCATFGDEEEIMHDIDIDMPETWFDIITWEKGTFFGNIFDNPLKYFIKLNTITNERYFFVNSEGIHQLPLEEYMLLSKKIIFNITCRGLKEFKLTHKDIENDEDYYTHSWYF